MRQTKWTGEERKDGCGEKINRYKLNRIRRQTLRVRQ